MIPVLYQIYANLGQNAGQAANGLHATPMMNTKHIYSHVSRQGKQILYPEYMKTCSFTNCLNNQAFMLTNPSTLEHVKSFNVSTLYGLITRIMNDLNSFTDYTIRLMTNDIITSQFFKIFLFSIFYRLLLFIIPPFYRLHSSLIFDRSKNVLLILIFIIISQKYHFNCSAVILEAKNPSFQSIGIIANQANLKLNLTDGILYVDGKGTITHELINDALVGVSGDDDISNLITEILLIGTGWFKFDENGSFYRFPNLESIQMLNTGKENSTIMSYSFSDCLKLKNFTFTEHVFYVGSYVFQDTLIEEIKIPTCKWVDWYCFKNCKRLKSVHFLGYTMLGMEMFYGCTSLQTVYYCSKVHPVKPKASYTNNIFATDGVSFASRIHVEVPTNYDSNKFMEYDITAANKVVNVFTFKGIKYTYEDNTVKIVGSGVTDKKILDDGFKVKCSCVSNSMEIIEMTTQSAITTTSALGFSRSENLKTINCLDGNGISFHDQCFMNCPSLSNFNVGAGASIYNQVFSHTNLSYINIFYAKKVGNNCFEYCNNLITISLVGTVNLYEKCFYNCPNLREIYYCGSTAPTSTNYFQNPSIVDVHIIEGYDFNFGEITNSDLEKDAVIQGDVCKVFNPSDSFIPIIPPIIRTDPPHTNVVVPPFSKETPTHNNNIEAADKPSKKSNVGAIAGGVTGGLLFLLLLILLVLYIIYKSSQHQIDSDENHDTKETDSTHTENDQTLSTEDCIEMNKDSTAVQSSAKIDEFVSQMNLEENVDFITPADDPEAPMIKPQTPNIDPEINDFRPSTPKYEPVVPIFVPPPVVVDDDAEDPFQMSDHENEYSDEYEEDEDGDEMDDIADQECDPSPISDLDPSANTSFVHKDPIVVPGNRSNRKRKLRRSTAATASFESSQKSLADMPLKIRDQESQYSIKNLRKNQAAARKRLRERRIRPRGLDGHAWHGRFPRANMKRDTNPASP